MNTDWDIFVKQAKEVYSAFSNEQLIKNVLKSRGETTFKPEYSNKLLYELKFVINEWQNFIQDVKEMDCKFPDDKAIAKILAEKGICWYGGFDSNKGLNVLKEWADYKDNQCLSWDYPCPICGALTQRARKYDWMYRKECDGLGWICSAGGVTHFHTAAWAPLKMKFVTTKELENESEK